VSKLAHLRTEEPAFDANVYLVGEATAVLHGWRATTVDIDLKMEPEPPGACEAITRSRAEGPRICRWRPHGVASEK
jgi:hypothetical protein